MVRTLLLTAWHPSAPHFLLAPAPAGEELQGAPRGVYGEGPPPTVAPIPSLHTAPPREPGDGSSPPPPDSSGCAQPWAENPGADQRQGHRRRGHGPALAREAEGVVTAPCRPQQTLLALHPHSYCQIRF